MTTPKLAEESCAACDARTPRLTPDEAKRLAADVPAWEIAPDGASLHRRWVLRDFATAVAFVQQIAVVADKENHHPDVHITGYKHLAIDLSTHAIGGLSRNDFILAAKIDALAPAI